MFGINFKAGTRWSATLALAAMGLVGFGLGVWSARTGEVSAQTPQVTPVSGPGQSDYSKRVVAYIYDNIPVTREELGEFLIARHGTSAVQLLVNRKIIDHACAKHGVKVSPQEVQAAIEEDLKQLNVDRATFVKQFLKQYNKTLYEWQEDVIKPRLLLKKLCEQEIKVNEEEMKKVFESQYGEKVECRIIVWPAGQEKIAYQMYDALRKSEGEFDSAARNQAIPALAANGGRISPIGHFSADNDLVEKIAFKLKPKEVSELFVIPNQGTAVLRCERKIPALYKDDAEREQKYKTEYKKFYQAVFDKKLEKAIPPLFAKLSEEAKPNIVLQHGTSDQDVIKAVEEELKLMQAPEKGLAPVPGNAAPPAMPAPPGKQ
ncbi:MAG TPA: peptidylprolyl isomerase [Gemmataceae bacterium]|nr:peptidylprolyl isomerase [Gemmataceae bacterium]